MKKYILPLTTILLSLTLTACGNGISSEDYETIKTENASLRRELTNLQVEQIEQIQKQHAEELTEIDSKVWLETSFGDNSICFSDSEKHYLQCIAGKTYSIATEDIYNLVHDVQLSLALLDEFKDSIEYEQISIKFADSSGVYILEVILNLYGDSYILDGIMCDAIYADAIIFSLQNIGNPDN